jgi:hypothetical protein
VPVIPARRGVNKRVQAEMWDSYLTKKKKGLGAWFKWWSMPSNFGSPEFKTLRNCQKKRKKEKSMTGLILLLKIKI